LLLPAGSACKYATDDIDKFWKAKGTKNAMAVERKERTVPGRWSDGTVVYCLIGTVPVVLFLALYVKIMLPIVHTRKSYNTRSPNSKLRVSKRKKKPGIDGSYK
jgi:hypothetical protein